MKELIIISLTSLQHVYGRPKRSDFFEQIEEMIQFAEMIYLRLDSLDHMASFIQSMYDENEERKQREREELAQQFANKKRFSIPKLIPVRMLQQKSGKCPEIHTDLSTSPTKQKLISRKESKMRFLIGTAIIIVGALLLNIFLTSANKNAESTDRQTNSHQEEKDVDKDTPSGNRACKKSPKSSSRIIHPLFFGPLPLVPINFPCLSQRLTLSLFDVILLLCRIVKDVF